MSLRVARQALIDDVTLQGDEFCQAYTHLADEWLTQLVQIASGGDLRGLALLAVGGYGRGELCPYSDLDVLLVHKGHGDVAGLAERIWYPIWDEGVALDHSVRRPAEVVKAAGEDLRVSLGLLDARLVVGDSRLADSVISGARERWQRQKPKWLVDLARSVEERHYSHGDLGFLLEPDLKESHGGLRDVTALRALLLAEERLYEYVDVVAMETAAATLRRVRVELHRRSGRESNQLLLQEQPQVAVSLGVDDAADLMRSVATAGRTIAWEEDDAWRRWAVWAENLRRGRRQRRKSDGVEHEVEPTGEPDIGLDVVEHEVVLLGKADVAGDPSLPLRLAAVAAERDHPIGREALNLLGRKSPAPPLPWSGDVRASFIRLLSTGPPAIGAIEALDRRHIWERYVPEWPSVRNRPQRNPYHRFTVDRHLLEATANAATLAHRTSRPDLLVLGSLFHDIGKGFPGDHTEVGVELVEEIGPRMGLEADDVDVLAAMVRYHLLLPETATRRDLDDPATAERVAAEVESRTVLELLHLLCEADSLATGPSAWGTWKAGLVAELVERTTRRLSGEEPAPPTPWVTGELLAAVARVRASGVAMIDVLPPQVTVVAPDRPGLLAEVTGVLALHGLNVRSAVVAGEDGVAIELFVTEPARGQWPPADRLDRDLSRVQHGDLDLEAELAERAHTYRRDHRLMGPLPVTPTVMFDNHASHTATVVEVRAEDSIGQLHRITQALADCQLDVSSAKVSTFANAVVDAFYVRTTTGGKLTDADGIETVTAAILQRIDQTG